MAERPEPGPVAASALVERNGPKNWVNQFSAGSALFFVYYMVDLIMEIHYWFNQFYRRPHDRRQYREPC